MYFVCLLEPAFKAHDVYGILEENFKNVDLPKNNYYVSIVLNSKGASDNPILIDR